MGKHSLFNITPDPVYQEGQQLHVPPSSLAVS